MKKILFTCVLGSTAILSADQYQHPYGSQNDTYPASNSEWVGYQNQPSNAYYQSGRGNEYQGQSYNQGQPYNQGQSYNQGQPYNQGQSYNQGQPQGNYYQRDNRANYQQPSYGQNQQFDQYNRPNHQEQPGYRDGNRGYGIPVNPELWKKIHDKLSSGWFSNGSQDVSFEINNGNVILTGYVDSLETKNKVEENVKKIDGVKSVDNQLIIKSGSVTDQDLNKKIHDTLSSGWFSKGYQDVVFDIYNGNVTLKGSVDSLDNKNKAEESVKKIDGVKSVDNQITVKTK